MTASFTIDSLTIDCANSEETRDFYAGLMSWEKIAAGDCPALKTGNGMTILFAETDVPYVPPVWPEEPGKQQKQVHLDFVAADLPSAVNTAVRLGATKCEKQYDGVGCITMLDPEGHPFCLCKGSETKSQFDLYFEEKGYGAMPNISINIDCREQKICREFYAQLTGWDQGFHWSSLVADNGMVVCFQGCDNDGTMEEYTPPVWPEQSGKEQKQMHFDFQVDDLQSAVEKAVGLGARKPVRQYGGEQWVTLLDIDGHPFCLRQK